MAEANALVKLNYPNRSFVVDSNNAAAIRALLCYFTGQPAEGLNPNKGILLCGNVGVGKSLLMKAIANTLKRYYKAFRFVVCQDVVLHFENTGDLDTFTANRNGMIGRPAKICFDELGRELIPANNYGNKRNVMQHILMFRYNAWQDSGLLTHGTTNATPRELENLYGAHIADRIREMFNWVVIHGDSRRNF